MGVPLIALLFLYFAPPVFDVFISCLHKPTSHALHTGTDIDMDIDGRIMRANEIVADGSLMK